MHPLRELIRHKKASNHQHNRLITGYFYSIYYHIICIMENKGGYNKPAIGMSDFRHIPMGCISQRSKAKKAKNGLFSMILRRSEA